MIVLKIIKKFNFCILGLLDVTEPFNPTSGSNEVSFIVAQLCGYERKLK